MVLVNEKSVALKGRAQSLKPSDVKSPTYSSLSAQSIDGGEHNFSDVALTSLA